jgi:hypothetical protein
MMQLVSQVQCFEVDDPTKVQILEVCGCGRNLTNMGQYRDLVHYRDDSELRVPCVGEKTNMFVSNR